MKQRVINGGRRMLLVLLVASLLAMWVGVGVVSAQEANPVRTLPATVAPGEEFEVTVTFTSPANDFNSIGLNDAAPAGWSVTVNAAWVSPSPTSAWNPESDEAEFWWDASFSSGTTFTVMYKVQVPEEAGEGSYNFAGTLVFFILGAGPYEDGVGGDATVTVGGEGVDSSQVGLKARTAEATGCLKLIKLFQAPPGVEFPQIEVQVRVTGTDFDQTYTLKASESWEKVVCNITVGTYTVQELTAEPGWKASYDPASRELEVTAGDTPGSGATMTIINAYTVIGVSVTPSEIDFGEITPGETKSGNTITVTNTGGVPIDVSAELDADTVYNDGGDYFYTGALRLAGVGASGTSGKNMGTWTAANLGLANLASTHYEDVTTGLVCPAEMYAGTEYDGTLIFWAVAAAGG